jgi:radical SAM superfamily enzyme YgiQ (UPF0313 family)
MGYVVQIGAAPLAAHPELVALMARANMRVAIVGMESLRDTRLAMVHKPATADINRRAAALLHQHGIALIASLIAGFPDDTRASIRADAVAARRLKPDAFIMQMLTPYPGTQVRASLLQQNLIASFDYDRYDGIHGNVRTHALSAKQLERCVTRETFRTILSPAFIARNRLLRLMPFGAVRAQLTSFFHDLGEVLFGKRWGTRYSPRHPATSAKASRAA